MTGAQAVAKRPGDWRARALCLGASPELWFPEGGPPGMAKRICRACPVRAECLAFAIATSADYGIWGGLTPDERRALGAARSRPCRHCGGMVPLPAVFCGQECRAAARRKSQAESQRRRGYGWPARKGAA